MKILRSKIVKPKISISQIFNLPLMKRKNIKNTDYMTDDEEKADEESFSIIAFWNWERRNYFIKKVQ